MAHNYHWQCGCSDCCRVEEADEQRDEAIDAVAKPAAKILIGAEDFAWGALVDMAPELKNSILQDVGRFFERYHAIDASDTQRAMEVARDLYLELLPQIEAATLEQARDEAAAVYDRAEAA